MGWGVAVAAAIAQAASEYEASKTVDKKPVHRCSYCDTPTQDTQTNCKNCGSSKFKLTHP